MENIKLSDLAKNIKLRRARLGLNQLALAEAADLHINVIKKIEGGRHEGSFKSRQKIAKALGCQIADLYFLEPHMPQAKPSDLSNKESQDVILKRLEAIDSKIESIKSLNEAPIDIVKALKNASPGQLEVIREALNIHPSQDESEDDQKARSSN